MSDNRWICLKIARERELPLGMVEAVMADYFQCLTEQLCHEGKVEIRGFGKWIAFKAASRKIYNPQNGGRLQLAPHTRLRFQPAAKLRRLLREPPAKVELEDAPVPWRVPIP